MGTVELRFSPLPAHVRTARLVAVSLARRAGLDEEVLDEVRLAVGEAASRAVGRHEVDCPAEPVLVRLTDADGLFVAEVVDRAHGSASGTDVLLGPVSQIADHPADELPAGFDLAVIGGLVQDVSVEVGANGSVVRMCWPVPTAPRRAAVPVTQSRSPGEPAH